MHRACTLNTSSPLLRRCWCSALLASTFVLAGSLAAAQTTISSNGFQTSGSVIGDEVMYSIGGGNAVSMSGAASMRSIGVGAGWNSNLVCGDLSISTTIQNQLNGLTDGFQTLMSSVIQNATSAVASLPALIIQRADPGLYNLLTNGILQARLDFDRSKLTCQAMANRMADMAGGQRGWNQLSEGMVLQQAVASTDAVSAIEQAEISKGNEGVPWVGGSNAGGTGQPSIKVVSDVTRAGYNLVNGRAVSDTAAIDPTSCDSLACQTWSSPQAAVAWATRVLGEQEQRTCEHCTKTETTPGVGLTPLIQDEYDSKLQALQELITGARPTTFANLREAGSSSLPITRGVIEALRDEPDQAILAHRLASEVALSSVLEKALLLQRTLLTGMKEPNVAANQLAVDAVDHESNLLDREILNLKTELELRRELANNSPMAIIQRFRTRAAGSRGIYEGDPVPDRLDQLQRTSSGASP
uniref:integrating conjugative element protein n=1 Tax=Marinobacterium profundum TaxID=1714300 RepID=UPI00082EAEB5|nr:integrating conjugative element protein [Marinobacterium profundum]